MKILVLDEEFPFPLNTGKRIRSFNLTKRIAQRHELHYLAYATGNSEAFKELERAGIYPIAVSHHVPPKSGVLFYFRLLMNLFSKYPYIVTSHYSKIFQKHLEDALDRIRPDLIICEWSPYAIFGKNITDTKIIIVAHNVESRIWERYYENEPHPIKKWYIKKQMQKVARFEHAVFNWADGATAVSAIETQEIQSYNPLLNVETVENGVDLQYFVPDYNRRVGKELIFVGSMNWRPNQDAIKYFVEDIFPLVLEKDNDIIANFVGQNPPPFIEKLNDIPGIKIVGRVDDVRPYVHNGAVYIVPLRIGGGTRLKIIEALAMGKAVVSTRVGAEGLNVTDGQDIMLADTPEEFADKIMVLMHDAQLRNKLGAAGRKLVESFYGWDMLADKLERFLIGIVERK